uniref:Uncharacterized protein n=1 Tax=Arion vulgaris TaxID=1028688 RepID=A0A0B6YH19_9EUPU
MQYSAKSKQSNLKHKAVDGYYQLFKRDQAVILYLKTVQQNETLPVHQIIVISNRCHY